MDHSLSETVDDDEDLPLSHPARVGSLGGKHQRKRKHQHQHQHQHRRNHEHEHDDEDDSAEHCGGRGRGGWGESMELDHQRELLAGKQRKANASGDERNSNSNNNSSNNNNNNNNNNNATTVVAVDLNQFRNTEVGRGYQAKHVVRQRSVAASAGATTITTDNNNNNNNNNTRTIVNSSEIRAPVFRGDREGGSCGPLPTKTLDTNELLRNDGLRAFRREIETILSS